ncbi:MAG: TonB-dependent receptor [Thermoanaerobaculia bacterium]
MSPKHSSRLAIRALCLAAALALAGHAAAVAQKTTGGIRGTLVSAAGPVAGATVNLVNADSGFVRETTTDAAGAFALAGLTPGNWEIFVTAEGFQEQRATLQVLIGKDSVIAFAMTAPTVVEESIEVVGEAPASQIDARNSEISTNITPAQIENLPLNNRNFLAFAALAPGVSFTVDQDATGQGFRSGGSNPKQVNVFIDGLSYKNDILQGGAFMQDSSRGNPFPQSAVQEYRVLTQNFKAEYEKAAAAVITAVTKSGGNSFHGEVFALDQTKAMVTQDDITKARGDEKADYKRRQYGFSLGGPIVKDKVNFFVTFEQNKQDRAASVFRGGAFDFAPANVESFLSRFPVGTLTVPFDEKLYFAKLSLQASASQLVDFSWNRRDEQEIRGFGGQRTEDGAESFEVGTDAFVLKHQLVLGNRLNEAGLSYQKLQWHPTALDFASPHLVYDGLLDVGGKDSSQDLEQKKTTLRDDFSWNLSWHGAHTLKTGLTATQADYDFTKRNQGNPTFFFRSQEGWQFPYRATYGFGDPGLVFGNSQYGLYVQDDWQPIANLTINAGVRWDYETNMIDNDFRTPQAIADGLRTACRHYDQPVGGRTDWCISDFLDVENYISDGGNRSSYKGMIQPRVGFTYDVSGQGSTVVFGGWGKYYDRVTLNDIFDEKYRQSWKVYEFCFSPDGSPTPGCGAPAIAWDPSYQNQAALDRLIASGATGGPEVFILGNDTRPPYTNQWSLGVRQKLGIWNASLSYANSRGYNGLLWTWGAQPPGTEWGNQWGTLITFPGYANVFRSYDVRRTWYDGYFLTLAKPYTARSPWSFDLSYTYSKGQWQASGDEGVAFAFDFLPYQWPKFPANGDERHHLVMTGTVGLPANFRVSSVITLGSGTPFTIFDDSGSSFAVRYNAGRPEKFSFIVPDFWAYRSVDLRLEWDAPPIAKSVRLGLIAEGFNIFNFKNYNGFESFKPHPPAVNPNFGKPNSAFNTRRYQIGARVSF